jgi:hypothetical protein
VTAVWVAVLAGVVALAYYGMWLGWRHRAQRQADLAEPSWLDDLVEPPSGGVAGTYVSTTAAGHWLDRIAAHGLGTLSKATVASDAQSLQIRRSGARGFRIPADALVGVRRERGIAGKVRDPGGVVVITWRLGGHELDTGFRPDHKVDLGQVERSVVDLMDGARHV